MSLNRFRLGKTKAKWAGIVALLAIGASLLAACGSAKSYPNQITLVIGNGVGDNHKVEKIAYPGDSVSIHGDESQWFLPAGARNFVITTATDHGDRHNPSVAYTAAGADGTPRMQDNVQLTTNWSLNENADILKEFAVECGKYTCYDTHANENHSNDPHSSAAGWFNMLSETISPSIDRAVQDAMANYPPTLWSDRTLWTKFGDEVSKDLMAELRTNWSTIDPKADFFCGNGETTRTTACAPIQVIIDNIAPADPRIQTAAQDRAVLEAQAANNVLQAAQAKVKYGADYQYWLGVLDAINACNAKATCILNIGSQAGMSSATPVPVTAGK